MYIEKYLANSINNETIIQQFQNMKNLQKKILKFYVFAISFLCQCIQVLFLLIFFNLNFLMNTLNKIFEVTTAPTISALNCN